MQVKFRELFLGKEKVMADKLTRQNSLGLGYNLLWLQHPEMNPDQFKEYVHAETAKLLSEALKEKK